MEPPLPFLPFEWLAEYLMSIQLCVAALVALVWEEAGVVGVEAPTLLGVFVWVVERC